MKITNEHGKVIGAYTELSGNTEKSGEAVLYDAIENFIQNNVNEKFSFQGMIRENNKFEITFEESGIKVVQIPKKQPKEEKKIRFENATAEKMYRDIIEKEIVRLGTQIGMLN